MATLVGTQTEFSDALKELIELDYEAIEAYEAAINRLENQDFKSAMEKFASDHRRHVRELNTLLESHGHEPVEGPGAKQWLTKGKVVLAGLIGDDTIMAAMHSNEEDTNTAYERMCKHEGIWSDAKDIIKRGLNDEHHHKQWIEQHRAS